MTVDSDNLAPALPPHSIEAEQSILGAILLDNSVLDRVNGNLAEMDFYAGAHRAIFAHELALHDEGKPVDVITLRASLDAAGKLDYVGGMDYLGALVANVPTAANAEHYAAIIRERAECRRVAAMALDVHAAAMHPLGLGSTEIGARLTTLLRQAEGASRPRWSLPVAISTEEFASARLTPDCIVENYLFADVAVIVAPGNTGKTTVLLYEAIHIVLGMPLYGLTVEKPGPVVIITAEDSREMLVARLRRMVEAMQLSADELARVLAAVRISDVCGTDFKLTRVVDDMVLPAPLVDVVIGECKALQPVLVTLDPAICFGVGESRVNDAEQGLVEAARRIRSALNCCVRYVHHTGKLNARDETTDQYTGRGGSAMPDGCRMVAVLQPMKADKWLLATGMALIEGEIGMVLARPKVSYAQPPHPDILICRKGYAFTHRLRDEPDRAGKLQSGCDQIMRALATDLDKGTFHSKNSLEALALMPRAELRAVLATLEARGRIEHAERPDKARRGARTYLRPVATPNATGEPT